MMMWAISRRTVGPNSVCNRLGLIVVVRVESLTPALSSSADLVKRMHGLPVGLLYRVTGTSVSRPLYYVLRLLPFVVTPPIRRRLYAPAVFKIILDYIEDSLPTAEVDRPMRIDASRDDFFPAFVPGCCCCWFLDNNRDWIHE